VGGTRGGKAVGPTGETGGKKQDFKRKTILGAGKARNGKLSNPGDKIGSNKCIWQPASWEGKYTEKRKKTIWSTVVNWTEQCWGGRGHAWAADTVRGKG